MEEMKPSGHLSGVLFTFDCGCWENGEARSPPHPPSEHGLVLEMVAPDVNLLGGVMGWQNCFSRVSHSL